MTDRNGLTPEEDDELRRVAFLAQFGNVAEHLGERFRELRARDRRAEVRDPIATARTNGHDGAGADKRETSAPDR